MQRAAKELIAQEHGGRIINIASIAGKGYAGTSNAAYAASKGAVISMTHIAALQLGKYDINVNAICQGAVITDMFNKFVEGQRTKVSEWVAKQQVSRPQTGQEIAHAISFLHEARSISGQALNVDGGTVFN